MEITVIDDGDRVGWLASATRLGEVYMYDVRSMVVGVSAKAGTTRITRLNILDHGNKGGIEIGKDWIDMSTLGQFEKMLALLKPKFATNGFVHLQHCKVGQNERLLLELARIFGVSVYAGTASHNPIYRFNFGHYNRAMPGGNFDRKVGRP